MTRGGITVIVAVVLAAAQPAAAIPVSTLMAQAAADHTLVMVAQAEVRAVDEQIREGNSGLFPSLSLSTSYSRVICRQAETLCGETTIMMPRDNILTGSLQLQQSIFDYQVFVGLEVAQVARELATEQVRGMKQRVVADVRLRYLDALLAQERVRQTQASIDRRRKTRNEVAARVRHGLATADELLQTEVRLATVEALLLQVRNQEQAALRALRLAAAIDPAAEVQVEGALDQLQLAEGAANSPANEALLAAVGATELDGAAEDDLLRLTLSDLSDLRQLRRQRRLNGLQVQVRQAAFYPTIRAGAKANFAYEADDGDQLTAKISVSAQVVGTIPLFTGFSRAAQHQRAMIVVEQDTLRLAHAEREALSQTRTLTDAVSEARARAATQQRATGAAQRAFEVALANYREGVGTQLQITEAETTLRETEFNYAAAVYDYLAAVSRLQVAVGQVPFIAFDLAHKRGY